MTHEKGVVVAMLFAIAAVAAGVAAVALMSFLVTMRSPARLRRFVTMAKAPPPHAVGVGVVPEML